MPNDHAFDDREDELMAKNMNLRNSGQRGRDKIAELGAEVARLEHYIEEEHAIAQAVSGGYDARLEAERDSLRADNERLRGIEARLRDDDIVRQVAAQVFVNAYAGQISPAMGMVQAYRAAVLSASPEATQGQGEGGEGEAHSSDAD